MFQRSCWYVQIISQPNAVNQGQYLAGYASYLKLNIGSIPTVRDASGDPEAGCSRQPTRPDVACQTDPVEQRSVHTQLSWRTFHPFVRSKGVQATVSCKDFRGGTDPVLYDEPLPLFTSTPAKRPAKRPRLELEEEDEEDALEGSSSFLAPQGLDATYDPEESVTHVTASTDTSGQAPTATHNVNSLRIRSTTQAGITTRILRPRKPQHQLTKLLYARYLYWL